MCRFVDGIEACAGPRLRPDGAAELVDAFLDAWPRVEAAYYAVLTAKDQPGADAAVADFGATLGALEALLEERGGPLLLGADVSLAEAVAAPWVQRWAVTLPRFRKVDLEADVLAPRGLARVAAWARAVAARTRTEDAGSATSLTAPAPAYAPGASRTTSAFNSAFAEGFARANSRPMCVSLALWTSIKADCSAR